MNEDYLLKWIDSGTNSLTIEFVSDSSEVREGVEVLVSCFNKNTAYANRFEWRQLSSGTATSTTNGPITTRSNDETGYYTSKTIAVMVLYDNRWLKQ